MDKGIDYVGMTVDLERRLKEHNSGKTKSTKGYKPWKMIHSDVFEERQSALKREKYLKSGYGKMWIRKKWPPAYLR